MVLGAWTNDILTAGIASFTVGKTVLVVGGQGNDTFIISAGDLASLSTLQGGAGLDTLKIASPQTLTDSSWLHVSGIERIVLLFNASHHGADDEINAVYKRFSREVIPKVKG